MTTIANHLHLSLLNVAETNIGQGINFVNLVVSKAIMAMKVMTVVSIRLHAKFARMKKHHGWRKTINTAAVVLCF